MNPVLRKTPFISFISFFRLLSFLFLFNPVVGFKSQAQEPPLESLVFAGPTSSMVSIPVTVSELFAEISIHHDDFNGWKAVGQELGLLAGWAQTKHRQEKLIEISRADYEIPVTLVNEIPLVLNEENREFFSNKNISKEFDTFKEFPFDGTWAGSKYIFYPHSVVDTDEISEDDLPISFYLVKKISSKPQPLNFKKGKESLHLGEQFYHFAITARARGDLRGAIAWFKKSAAAHNPRANLLLSQFYLEGRGVAKNYDDGIKHLTLSAVQGDPEAQYQLGLFNYYTLPMTKESRTGALAWFSKANEQGHLRARFYLAGLYESGKCVDKNEKEAQRLFTQVARKSADGSVLELRAQIRVDELIENEKSYFINKLQLIKMALGGVPNAMAAVAAMAFDNQLDIPISMVQEFLTKATESGNHEAMIMIKSNYFPEIL